jgi:site-specific DNA-cytosine methylase
MFKDTVQKLIDQHEKDKENLFRLIKTFQDRVVVLENQVKLLAQPKKKWYEIWK